MSTHARRRPRAEAVDAEHEPQMVPRRGRVPAWTRGDKFRKARSETGLTVREFARLIGISPKSVNNYEGDHVEPRPIVINAWALATGVSKEWLEKEEAPRPGDGGPGEGLDTNRIPKRTRRDLNPQPSDPRSIGYDDRDEDLAVAA